MLGTAWWRQRGPAVAAVAATLALVVYAAAARLDALLTSPYPVGIDGYFYPVQLRSLLATGELYYPSSPLAIWFMAPAAWLTDPITGAKIGAAIGTAAGALPAYVLGRRLGGSRGLGLLAATLWATSAESFYLSAEFVKSGIGLSVAAAYLCALLWALDAPSRRRVAVAAAALLATALTHKQATALALVVSAPAVVAHLRQRGVTWPAVAGAGGLVAAVVAGLGLLMPERFLGAADAGLLASMWTADADLSAPVLVAGGVALRFGHEALMAGVAGVALLAVAAVGRRVPALATGAGAVHDRAAGYAAAAVAVVIALPWVDVGDPQGLGFRLRLMAFVLLILCVVAACGRILARVQPMTRRALVLGFAVGWVGSRPPTTTEGMVVAPPHMVAAIRAAGAEVPDDHVVICPQRSLVFMITWHTGRRARLRPDGVAADRRWRLLPGRLMHPELIAAVDAARRDPPAGVPPPIGLHPRHQNGVLLVPEITWRHLMTLVSPAVRDTYRAWRTI